GARGAAAPLRPGGDRRRGEGLDWRPGVFQAARRRVPRRRGGGRRLRERRGRRRARRGVAGRVRGVQPAPSAVPAQPVRRGHVPEWGKTAIFSYARLLAEDTRWGEARAILTDFLRRADGADAADAAYALGETYQGEGDFPAAAEYFMTAAYVAPESAAGRRAL